MTIPIDSNSVVPLFVNPQEYINKHGNLAFVGYYTYHLAVYRLLDETVSRSMQSQIEWTQYRAWLGEARELLPVWAFVTVGSVE